MTDEERSAAEGLRAGAAAGDKPPRGSSVDQIALLLLTLLGLSIVAAVFWPTRDLIVSGKNDFIPPYVAARLAGGGELYSAGPYYDFMTGRFGEMNESLRFTRPPFYAALLSPLRLLSFEHAYIVWWVLRIAALAAFLLLWKVPSSTITILFTAMSLPVFGSLAAGQDAVFLLAFIAAALHRWKRGKHFQAGLALACCAIKFHLFVLLPLLFWRLRLRRMAAGFAAGAAFFLLLSFAVEGSSWPSDYYRTLTDSRVHPELASMPNLHGLLSGLPYSVFLEALAAVAVVGAAWKALQAAPFLNGLCLTLVAGLLLSYHSYLMDAAILLPALLIAFQQAKLPAVKLAAAMLLSPPAALLLVSLRPMSYWVQGALLILYFALVWDTLRVDRRTARCD